MYYLIIVVQRAFKDIRTVVYHRIVLLEKQEPFEKSPVSQYLYLCAVPVYFPPFIMRVIFVLGIAQVIEPTISVGYVNIVISVVAHQV